MRFHAKLLAFAALLGLCAGPSYASSFDAKPQACVVVIQSGTAGLTASTAQAGIVANTNVCFTFDLPNGTGNSQANQHYAATRTLAASTGEDLDLVGSTLKDPLGNALAFTKVRYIIVHAAATNASTITIKPGASNGFNGPFGAATHTISIPAGGWFTVAAPVAGWAVTAATGDLFHVGNDDSGGTAAYDIVIVGN